MRKTHAIASDTFVSISVVYFLIVESNMLLNTLEENLRWPNTVLALAFVDAI